MTKTKKKTVTGTKATTSKSQLQSIATSAIQQKSSSNHKEQLTSSVMFVPIIAWIRDSSTNWALRQRQASPSLSATVIGIRVTSFRRTLKRRERGREIEREEGFFAAIGLFY